MDLLDATIIITVHASNKVQHVKTSMILAI